MSKPNKYSNMPVYFNLEHDMQATHITGNPFIVKFDSILEYNVYCGIKSIVKPSNISIHKPIPIWGKTNRHYPLTWCVDFTIHTSNGDIYVEAKGVKTEDFKHRIRAIDYVNPELLDRMIFVSQNKQVICGKAPKAIYTYSLQEFISPLRELINKVESKL